MIAVIPARGGSKGLPGKNIKLINGKPLIQYTIEAALNSKTVSRVIVSTDDQAIANVAKNAGAEVPFIRPDYLASDTASAVDVYIHATEYLRDNSGEDISKFMILLPTAPLRSCNHIDEAYELFCSEKGDTLVSVKESETPPSWFMMVDDFGRIKNAGFGIKEALVSNRQINDKYYVPNGAIYILDYYMLKEKRTYYSTNTVAYIMDRSVSIDIDTLDDFQYAEYLMTRE